MTKTKLLYTDVFGNMELGAYLDFGFWNLEFQQL
jgi:hypothetical protein